MDIQAISGTSLTIYLNSEELKMRNLKPDSMTKKEAEELLKHAAEKAGCSVSKKVFIELFSGKNDMLLFVRMSTCDPLFFAFGNVEDVISAAADISDILPSSLTYINNTYVLTVYPWERDMSASVLSEYGERLSVKPEFELYLFEHGKIILRTEAITYLKKTFSAAKSQ